MTNRREMKIEMLNPRDLNPSAYNPRKIDARAMQQLRRSLIKFGFVDPVQVRRAGNAIIGGHQRVKAAILEGLKSIPVVRLDISDQQAKLLNLTLNAEYGTVDVAKLSFLLKELKLDGADLELTGYDAWEIDRFTEDTAAVLQGVDLRPLPSMVRISLEIPFDRFAQARDALASLQNIPGIVMQRHREQ